MDETTNTDASFSVTTGDPTSWQTLSFESMAVFQKPSGWKCEMYGMGNNYVLMPTEGNVPNWFWRKMQYLAFGNKWIKESK